jgi:hypothetical protein
MEYCEIIKDKNNILCKVHKKEFCTRAEAQRHILEIADKLQPHEAISLIEVCFEEIETCLEEK